MTVVTDFGKKKSPLDSPFDQGFAPVEEAQPARPQTSSRPKAPSLAKAPKLGSPEQALGGLGSFFEQQQGQSRALADMATESGDFRNIKGDVNKLRQDPRNVTQAFEKETDDHLVDYVEKNELPPFIEDEQGNKLFLNTGTQKSIARVAGDAHLGSDGRYEASGPVGTYTAKWVPTESPLNNPLVSIAAGMVPGGTLFLQGMRVASGEKLTATDVLGAGLDGLKATGMLKPPQGAAGAKSAGETARRAAMDSGASFGDAIAAGKAAETAALAGKGLGGLSYAQTTGLMNAAASGNPMGAVMGFYGPQILEGTVGKLGTAGTDFANKLGIQPDDFNAGLGKTISSLASGADFKDALRSGFVEYIKEGGTLGDWDTFTKNLDIDLGPIEDAVRWAGRKIEDGARAVGSLVDDATWEQVKDTDLTGVEDALREAGSKIDDTVLQPVRQVGKDIDDKILQPVRQVGKDIDDAVRDTGKKIEDVVRTAVNPLDNWVDDLPKPPEIDLPEIDLPDIDLPDIDLPTGGLGGGFNLPMPSGSRTTDKLFDNELFKFKNKIELTDFGPLIQPQQTSIEDLLTSPFESDFAQQRRSI